jgi:arsenate reductase (glutaredoxin)
MITLFHNPRCGKSREGLAIVEKSGQAFEVVKYLENPLNVKELKELLGKLELKPLDLIRKKETIWVEQFKGKNLTDDEIIVAMAAYPILIERPIVIKGNKAIIVRPTEKILSFLS